MSNTYNAFTNKDSEVFKYHYQEYLRHKNEPKHKSPYDAPSVGLGAGILKSGYYQKRKFRHTAKRLRQA